jgi:hypothetical protein
MKKLLYILVLVLFFYNPASYAVIKGKGEVKLSEQALEKFIYYIRCDWPRKPKNQRCKPTVSILSSNGSWSYFHWCGHNECWANEKKTVERCERESGVSCGTFALRRTVYWENGINTKENKAKFKKKWSDQKIKDELAGLGFYGETTSSTISSTGHVTKKKDKKNKNIVEKIKELKKLYDDGIITKEEFVKAKNKILN